MERDSRVDSSSFLDKKRISHARNRVDLFVSLTSAWNLIGFSSRNPPQLVVVLLSYTGGIRGRTFSAIVFCRLLAPAKGNHQSEGQVMKVGYVWRMITKIRSRIRASKGNRELMVVFYDAVLSVSLFMWCIQCSVVWFYGWFFTLSTRAIRLHVALHFVDWQI